MITQEWGNAMQVHSLEAKLGLVKGIWINKREIQGEFLNSIS